MTKPDKLYENLSLEKLDEIIETSEEESKKATEQLKEKQKISEVAMSFFVKLVSDDENLKADILIETKEAIEKTLTKQMIKHKAMVCFGSVELETNTLLLKPIEEALKLRLLEKQ